MFDALKKAWVIVLLTAIGISLGYVFFSTIYIFLVMVEVLLLMWSIGFGILKLLRVDSIYGSLIAPGVGFVFFSLIAQGLSEAGFGLKYLLPPFVLLQIFLIVAFRKEIKLLLQTRIDYGIYYILTFLAVFFIYCTGFMLNDAVLKGGVYQWQFQDSIFFNSLAATLNPELFPPPYPGLPLLKLSYHYGTVALSAAISLFAGIDIADSFSRVVKCLGMIVAVLSVIGYGRILFKRGYFGRLAPFGLVIGLFFLGSGLLPLFRYPHPLFAKSLATYDLRIGLFAVGHNVIWGTIALISGLALWQYYKDVESPYVKYAIFIIFPAACIPTNVVVALLLGLFYAFDLLITAKNKANLVVVGGMALVMFLMSFRFNGLSDKSGNYFVYMLNPELAVSYFKIWMFLLLGVSIRLYPIMSPKETGLSTLSRICLAMLLPSVGVLLFVRTKVGENYNLSYPMIYCVEVLSAFTMAYFLDLTANIGNGTDTNIRKFLRTFLKVNLYVAAGAVLILVYGIVREKASPSVFVFYVGLAAIALVATFVVFLVSQKERYRRVPYYFIGLFILLGLVFGVVNILRNGYSISKKDFLHISKQEYEALRHLKQISRPQDIVATNMLELESQSGKWQSYAYSAVSERRVLLEGYSVETPYSKDVKEDNEKIFSSVNEEQVRHVLNKYDVRYIIPAPKTDLAVWARSPSWLSKIYNADGIEIYKVSESPKGIDMKGAIQR